MAQDVKGAVFAAVAACIGNFLQGWDNASISGAIIYIKKEFHLETAPKIEGLIMAMSLIGATFITTFSGAVSDKFGRRFMLRISAVLYFISGLIMLWAPNVYMLLLGRLLDGFGVGLAVTIVPLYISEISPPEIRGQLNTLPQLGGSGAMFLSYCVVFWMSLMVSPSWRLMLGILSLISIIYVGLTMFYITESPRWLVTKGQINEARRVLQKLRGTEDVSGELALLVEGLASGGDTTLEEYTIESTDEIEDKDQISLYGTGQGQSWIARPAKGQSNLGLTSRQGSTMIRSGSLVDPLVTLFGSVHEKLPTETGGTLFPNMGSFFTATVSIENSYQWNEEDDDNYPSDHSRGETDSGLKSPLLSHQASGMEKGQCLVHGIGGDSAMDIGGGWNLAYKYDDERKKEGLKRIYFQKESAPISRHGSILSVNGDIGHEGGEPNHVAALVSQRALSVVDVINPTNIQPSEVATKGSVLRDLCEPGVRHALFVGMGLLMLQQFCGINGILYYTPQLLEQAGVAQLLANTGMSSTSASILMSTFTMLVMLPCIVVAMRLMDVAGRRSLLLNTIPILIAVLVALIFSKIVDMGHIASAIISTSGVVLYLSFFVMGLGPIPNIFYSEIFPTKVRGICMAVCALTFWIFNMIVTYTLPLLLSSLGLVGVFSIYAVTCVVTWIFVYLKVPETKGMPLEVITEIFAAGSKKDADSN